MKKPTFRQVFQFGIAISIAHFLYFLFFPLQQNIVEDWNIEACVLQESFVHLNRGDCRFFYTRDKAISQLIQPGNNKLECVSLKKEPRRYKNLKSEQDQIRTTLCQSGYSGPMGKKLEWSPEIGWDAIGIWYSRALVLHSTRENSDGFLSTLMKAFSKDFAVHHSNVEHAH